MEYEKMYAELETILDRLEQGKHSLEATLKDYERGLELARSCAQMLDEVSGRIEKIGKGERIALNDDGNEA